MFLPADRLSSRERNRIIIDIVIIIGAAILIFWDFIIAPILAKGGESVLALALYVAYPILDIVLLFALIELIYRRWNSLHLGPMLFLLAAIVAAMAADISFSVQSSSETYVPGGLVDLGYVLGYVLFGLAGVYQAEEWRLHPKSISGRTRYDQSAWTRYLPYCGLCTAYLLLVWNQAHLTSFNLSLTTWGIGGIIGLVLVRQIVALNENNSLYLETKRENEERKAAEEALKESERRLADIIDFLPDATMVIDKGGKVISWNRAMEVMTGVKAEVTIGKGDYEYALPFYGQRRLILIDLVLNPQEEIEKNYLNIERKGKGDVLIGEVYIPNLKGGEAYLQGIAAALYDSRDNIVGAIESIRDISERKRAEEALHKAHDGLELRVKERTSELEARNAEMERFIYTVSHELRSPLISASGIMGFLRQDLEKGDAKRTETDLRLIEGAMTKMDQLLGEILELSRIGRVSNPPEDVSFDAIAKDALDQEAEKLRSRGVEVSIANDLPIVRVDRKRITEVMVNLLENSIKYMGDQAHPKIEIGHRKDEKETVFFVRDNGVGIDPPQQEKVFGLFYRLDPKSEGTGVGLTIVKRIIEVHGGRIWIESELGKGCTVCFTCP